MSYLELIVIRLLKISATLDCHQLGHSLVDVSDTFHRVTDKNVPCKTSTLHLEPLSCVVGLHSVLVYRAFIFRYNAYLGLFHEATLVYRLFFRRTWINVHLMKILFGNELSWARHPLNGGPHLFEKQFTPVKCTDYSFRGRAPNTFKKIKYCQISDEIPSALRSKPSNPNT